MIANRSVGYGWIPCPDRWKWIDGQARAQLFQRGHVSRFLLGYLVSTVYLYMLIYKYPVSVQVFFFFFSLLNPQKFTKRTTSFYFPFFFQNKKGKEPPERIEIDTCFRLETVCDAIAETARHQLPRHRVAWGTGDVITTK